MLLLLFYCFFNDQFGWQVIAPLTFSVQKGVSLEGANSKALCYLPLEGAVMDFDYGHAEVPVNSLMAILPMLHQGVGLVLVCEGLEVVIPLL